MPSAGPGGSYRQNVDSGPDAAQAPAHMQAREPLEAVRAERPGTQYEIAHQPLIGAARGKVDAAGFDVNRDRTGGLDDIRVDQCTVRVRQRAELPELVPRSLSRSRQATPRRGGFPRVSSARTSARSIRVPRGRTTPNGTPRFCSSP